MSVSYKKLWVLLAERSLSKVDLRKIAGITLHSLEKLLKDLNIEFEDKWDEKINREICRVDYYQRIWLTEFEFG